MFRLLKVGALALLLSVAAAIHVSAATIVDPIVRTKAGGGSIPVFGVPFSFPFGSFPSDPDGPSGNCFVDPEIDPMGILVSCAFQNLTNQPIGVLNFTFDYTNTSEGPPPLETFNMVDEGGFFSSITFTQFGAQFIGSGIPSGECPFEGECVGGEFIVELVGFPEGTSVDMAASGVVPEPMTLTLLATGLALGVGMRRRRT
jgi:hypothetical protein